MFQEFLTVCQKILSLFIIQHQNTMKVITVKPPKKRNPLVVPAITKTGAGKHKDKKKETKDKPIKE